VRGFAGAFATANIKGEKPLEIREAIERMYPHFDTTTRVELFARGSVPGWATYGFEARP